MEYEFEFSKTLYGHNNIANTAAHQPNFTIIYKAWLALYNIKTTKQKSFCYGAHTTYLGLFATKLKLRFVTQK